jgi:hypothetical protein
MAEPVARPRQPSRATHTVRLPGFVADREIGLGDVLKRATTLMGIRPCPGCAQRAERLNRRVVFRPRRHR